MSDIEQAAPTVGEWARTILAERDRQRAKGYDDAHDREHGVKHLLNWAIEYARLGEFVKATALVWAALDLIDPPQPPQPFRYPRGYMEHRAGRPE